MRKTKFISLALAGMLFFSLTGFTPAVQPVKSERNIGAHMSLQAKKSCEGHNYIVTQYGNWKLVSTYPGGLLIVTYKYERTVTEVCTKCADVKTHKEYKYEYRII